MNETQIKEAMFKVLKRIAPEADPETLKPTQDVRQTLDIDSYDFLMFLIGLNEEVGVEIPESDYGKLISTDDIVHYLSARVVKA
ncbi:MAG: acyl carrier protein [Anaerolineae bacterium]|nr:acyl carrier protein [Anaerolineae bacterium]